MGQKVNPIGFRLGVFKKWLGAWFAGKNSYGKVLKDDFKIRQFLSKNLSKTDYSAIEIERIGENTRVIVSSGKVGAIVGRGGSGIEKLRSDLKKFMGSSIDLFVKEQKNADMSAFSIASSVADQIENRANFKKVLRRVSYSVLRAGVKGFKIRISGRLGGAEIARKEEFKHGSIPLHTLRAKIDYALVEAKTVYGILGIKVWVCYGEY